MKNLVVTGILLIALTAVLCSLAVAADTTIRVSNFACDAWGWAYMPNGPEIWHWTAQIDPNFSGWHSNSGLMSFQFLNGSPAFSISDTSPLADGSYCAVNADPRCVVDGGHYSHYSFDLTWQKPNTSTGPLYVFLGVNGIGVNPASVTSYRTVTIRTLSGSMHVEGTMPEPHGYLALYVSNSQPAVTVVPEPASIAALLTGLAGFGGLALRCRTRTGRNK